MRDEKDDKANVNETPGIEKLYPRQWRQKMLALPAQMNDKKMNDEFSFETPRKQFPRQRRQKMLSCRLTRQRSDRGLSL